MEKAQKFKMMMEKRYGNEFELVLNSLYGGDIERMYHEFVLRKECYPYSSYKQTLYQAHLRLIELKKRGEL